MTKREATKLLAPFIPSPGYVLDFTRATLGDFVYDHVDEELEMYEQEGKSNAKRLHTLLTKIPDELAVELINQLNKYKEQS